MGNNQTQAPEMVYCDVADPGHEAMLVVQLYLMPAFFLGVLVLGLPLNLLSLWVFWRHTRRWTRGMLFLYSLALADASWLLALPFLIQYHLGGVRWALGQPLCRALRLLYNNYFYLSVFSVSCVSLDRYLAIVHPLRSAVLLPRRRARLLCLATWLVAMVMSLPMAYMTVTQRCPGDGGTVCALYVLLADARMTLPYSLSCSCMGFLLPFAVLAHFCLRSARALRSRSGSSPRLRALARVLAAVATLFGLLYLPYHGSRNAAVAVRVAWPRDPGAWRTADLAFSLEMCVCSLNTIANPLLSLLVARRFRREFWGALAVLRWCCCGGGRRRNAVSPEMGGKDEQGIAAVTPL